MQFSLMTSDKRGLLPQLKFSSTQKLITQSLDQQFHYAGHLLGEQAMTSQAECQTPGDDGKMLFFMLYNKHMEI